MILHLASSLEDGDICVSYNQENKMREINPRHKRFFLLEAFTWAPNMSEKEFVEEVSRIIFKAEIELNKSFLFRFHIHEDTKRNKNG